MKIKLTSIFVDDQEKALKFYTEVIGFIKKSDILMDKFRWLTLVSPSDETGTELVLEPANDPATKIFKKTIFKQGKPLNAFQVEDINEEYFKLKSKGVIFIKEPTNIGTIIQAIFDDTCGNLIQIYEIIEK